MQDSLSSRRVYLLFQLMVGTASGAHTPPVQRRVAVAVREVGSVCVITQPLSMAEKIVLEITSR